MKRALPLLALSASLQLAVPASAAPYHSPGYRGNNSFRNDVPAPLPPVALGTGKYPDLLVDGAGTGHVVFAQDGGTDAPDSLAFCNLQRGIKKCASAGLAPNPTAPDPSAGGIFAGNFPGGNHDFDGPAPLVMANQLFVLDRRFPDQFNTPTGTTSDSNVFEWSSDDGGATLTGPGQIGDNQMAGGAIVYGDPSAPSIGTISRTQTGGTTFQGVGPGQYTTNKAELGSGDQAYDGRLAVDESTPARLPVAAFADLSGNIFVREWSGQGDVNDASTWGESSFAGFSPSIVGGPTGVFVMYSDSRVNGGVLRLKRVVGGQPSGGALTLGRSSSEPAIAEDSTGRISFAYTDRLGVWTRSSSNGVTFSAAQYTAAVPRNGSIDRLATAATADGGGFVSFVRNGSGAEGIGQVVVAAFGSQQATPTPGLGGLPGGGLGSAVGDQMATSSCLTAKFGAVEAHINGSCFGHDAANPNLDVTLGEVNLNGLRIIPDPGTRIGIDPRGHTIDTTGKVRVVLTAGGLDITLWHEALHIKVPDDGPGDTLLDLKDFTGQVGPVIQGFPVDGDVNIKLANGGVDIPISLKLPKIFGGITGSATLHVTTSGGLDLSSLEFKVGDANLGALELKDVDVSYQQQGDHWTGHGQLLVPAGGGAFSATIDLEFAGGDFKSGKLDLGLGYPGLPIDANDPPPQLYLSHAGLGIGVDPLTLTGEAGFGVIPLKPTVPPGQGDPLKDYVFRLEGQLSVAFGAPVTITVSAQGFLYTLKVAESTLIYKFPDQVSMTGRAGYGNPGDLFRIDGQFGAIIDPKNKIFGATMSGDVYLEDVKIPISPAFAINNAGFDAFIPPPGVPIPVFPFTFIGNIRYHWGDAAPEVIPGLEDATGPFKAGIPQSQAPIRRAHAAGAMGFSVPAHAPAASLVVHGAGGAPEIALIAPGGQPVTLEGKYGAGQHAASLADAGANATYVGIQHPRPGRWTVAEASGNQVPITAVEYSIAESSPSVSARVTGSGLSRAVRYHVKTSANVEVTFAERAGRLLHVIGRARGRSGTIHFQAAFGPAGRRQLIAQITNTGLPLRNRTLGSFFVPRVPRPGHAAGLRVAAGRRAFTFTFRPPVHATRVLIRIVATDGRHLQRVVSPGTRGGSLPVIGFRDGITVTVVGLAPDGARGPATTARARRKK